MVLVKKKVRIIPVNNLWSPNKSSVFKNIEKYKDVWEKIQHSEMLKVWQQIVRNVESQLYNSK